MREENEVKTQTPKESNMAFYVISIGGVMLFIGIVIFEYIKTK